MKYEVTKDVMVRVHVYVEAPSPEDAIQRVIANPQIGTGMTIKIARYAVSVSAPSFGFGFEPINPVNYSATTDDLYSVLLEDMLGKARETLGDDVRGAGRLCRLAGRRSFLTNHGERIDDIADEDLPDGALPACVTWVREDGRRFQFMPSSAVFALLSKAMNGLATQDTQDVEMFCQRYGNKLDAILTIVQMAPTPRNLW